MFDIVNSRKVFRLFFYFFIFFHKKQENNIGLLKQNFTLHIIEKKPLLSVKFGIQKVGIPFEAKQLRQKSREWISLWYVIAKSRLKLMV